MRVCAGFVNGLMFFFHVYFVLRNFIFLCLLIGVLIPQFPVGRRNLKLVITRITSMRGLLLVCGKKTRAWLIWLIYFEEEENDKRI